jgi:hypothetical protein
METSPARPGPVILLAAPVGDAAPRLTEINPTVRPLDRGKWQNIVIHDSICEGTGNPQAGCHFVISAINSSDAGQMIHSTPLWQRQADGAHIFLVGHNFNTRLARDW